MLWLCIYEEISMVHEDKSSIRTYRIVDVDYCGAKVLLFAFSFSIALSVSWKHMLAENGPPHGNKVNTQRLERFCKALQIWMPHPVDIDK